jgi:hypothetical protein
METFKMDRNSTQSNSPSVSYIHVEYADGSFDVISLIQDGDFPLYSLDRKRAGAESVSLGAHTREEIAALLFFTFVSNQHTEYSARDPKVAALHRSWMESLKKANN